MSLALVWCQAQPGDAGLHSGSQHEELVLVVPLKLSFHLSFIRLSSQPDKGLPKMLSKPTPTLLSPGASPLSPRGISRLTPHGTPSFPAGFPPGSPALSVPPPCTDQGRTLAPDPLFISDTRPSAAAHCQHLQPAPLGARTAISPRGWPCLLPLNPAMEPRL